MASAGESDGTSCQRRIRRWDRAHRQAGRGPMHRARLFATACRYVQPLRDPTRVCPEQYLYLRQQVLRENDLYSTTRATVDPSLPVERFHVGCQFPQCLSTDLLTASAFQNLRTSVSWT